VAEIIKKVIKIRKWLAEFGGLQGDKAKWKRKQLGLPDILSHKFDGIINELLIAYGIICCNCRYAAHLLPLYLSKISISTLGLRCRPVSYGVSFIL